jgi:hypothetical protein
MLFNYDFHICAFFTFRDWNLHCNLFFVGEGGHTGWPKSLHRSLFVVKGLLYFQCFGEWFEEISVLIFYPLLRFNLCVSFWYTLLHFQIFSWNHCTRQLHYFTLHVRFFWYLWTLIWWSFVTISVTFSTSGSVQLLILRPWSHGYGSQSILCCWWS